jgi:nucleoside-diphosphate-sugar epimerase
MISIMSLCEPPIPGGPSEEHHMKLFVTGGTGLVGARLLPRLRDAGHECRALVRPGRDLPEGITRIEGDLLEPATLAPALDGVDAVIHLAALFRTDDVEAIHRVNLDGTRNLIEAVRAGSPHARVVMASTSNVYADVGPHPAREDDPTEAADAYPASKIAAEAELRESGLNWSILRFGFVYGDGDGHIDALPALVPRMGWHPAQALAVVHHRDVAQMVDLALEGAADGRIVNVVADAPATIAELTVIAGGPMPLSDEPLERPWAGHVDASVARSLGFRATVPTVYDAQRDGLL